MSSGILNIVNCSSVAYTKGCSTYPYPQVTSTDSGSQAVPGYNPTSYGTSHFTVYSQSASTQYYASFILQTQATQTGQSPSDSIANSVIAVPVYLQECATATDASGVRNILYHSSVADVTLNAPTNPNSSVYNIFMNMSLFDTVSGAPPGDTSGSTYTYPYFKNYTYNGTAPICDVLLTLSAQGKDMETAVFSLSSEQITANNTNTGEPISASITAEQLGKVLLTLNLPISSIFPQISTPGIIFRIKTEIIGYV